MAATFLIDGYYRVDNGFISLKVEYTLTNANVWEPDSRVTLRLTDADGVVVQEEEEVDEDGDSTWSYSSDDLSSTGDYVFSIISESGAMDWIVKIDVKY